MRIHFRHVSDTSDIIYILKDAFFPTKDALKNTFTLKTPTSNFQIQPCAQQKKEWEEFRWPEHVASRSACWQYAYFSASVHNTDTLSVHNHEVCFSVRSKTIQSESIRFRCN